MGNTQTLSIAGHSIRIKAPLAEGGQASVYVAEDELRRKYALKVCRAPRDESSMNHVFEMEMETHEAVPHHPNVVHLVGTKIDTTSDSVLNVYYLLLEYCPRSVQAMLEQVAKKKEAMPERDLLNVFISAASSLKHIHAQRIAHRDMKVENLLVGVDGTVKLCDFGSCSTDHRIFRNSTEVCYAKEDIEKHTTLAYRAPEQVDLYSGKCVCEKVDIWALGVLLYKLCFFRTPFEDKNGSVSNMAIMNCKYKIPTGMAYSEHRGILLLLRYMLQVDPDLRPSAAQVLEKVQQLMDSGDLVRVDDPALATPTAIARSPVFASTPRGGGDGGLAPSTPGSGTPRGIISPTQRRSLGLLTTTPGTGAIQGGGLSRSFGSQSRNSSFHKLSEDRGTSFSPPAENQPPQQPPDLSNLATVNRAAKPFTRERSGDDPLKLKSVSGGSSFTGMLGLMASKGNKNWMTKATSKEGGPPKAKYVRRLILSAWEQKLSPENFFMLLYQRPVTTNPVVALKGLITTLKVMQQGPINFLGQAASCVGMVDEIGKHWGSISSRMLSNPSVEYGADGYSTLPPHVVQSVSPSHSKFHLDVASVDLISHMAHLLVLKLHFHEQHSDFAAHFTAIPTMLGYDSVPVTGEIQDINALSRLLTIQDDIIKTQRLVFASQNENVQMTARWALLPLIEEAYTVFVACTFLLASLLELAARTQGLDTSQLASISSSKVSCKHHVTVLLALREQYESQLIALQAFYRQAEYVQEVKSMKRVPMMPAAVPVALDGALNWRPLTMRSPMVRVAGLSERARINDEIDRLVEERSHRAEVRSQLEVAQQDKVATVPKHRTAKMDEKWESFGGSTFPPPVQEIDTKQVVPQEARSEDWFFPSTVSEQGAFLDAITAAKQRSGALEDTSPSTSTHGALEDFLTGAGGRVKGISGASVVPGSRVAGPNNVTQQTASGLIGDSPHDVVASPNVGKEAKDLWADFFPNASIPGGSSVVKSSGDPEYGPQPVQMHKDVSIDLLAWSSSSDLDSEDDSDDEEGEEEVVAYNTKNMGDFLGSAVGHEREDVLASIIHQSTPPPPPPRPPPPPSTPPQQLVHPPGPLTAIVAAPTPPPIIEDSKARARKKEARSQPWRQNLKPNVAQALTACIRDFEKFGGVLPFDEIVVGNVIGHGAFATVYRGTCLQGMDVAIKKLMTQNHLPMVEKSVRDFCSEVALLRELRHPNIIALVGTCTDPIALLTEFCHKGNLFCILNDHSKYDLSWERKLSIACGLADGMNYLHSKDPILIHRDLKSLNVLINRDWVVKITDFGLSRLKPHSLSDIMTMQCGTYHWMAPEVINSTRYTEKADVYSFGIILWEIFTRAIPYEGLQPVQVVAAVINRGERPMLPADCPEDYANLTKACWSHDPANRPPFSDIAPALRAMHNTACLTSSTTPHPIC